MILIVDDTKEIVEWLVEAIRGDGYYADFAMDATSALYKMERIYYALALIDIVLPHGVDGNELARRVKCLPAPFCHVPLIAMTGGSRPVENGLFDAILHKPFLPRDLRAAITALAHPPLRELHIQQAQQERRGTTGAAEGGGSSSA